MMPLGSRAPIYFNLYNCKGEPNLGERILPLFYIIAGYTGMMLTVDG
jgi:hypothetical protein